MVPVNDGVVKAHLQAALAAGIHVFPDDVPVDGAFGVVIRLGAVKQAEPFMVLAGQYHVPASCVLRKLRPFFRQSFPGLEQGEGFRGVGVRIRLHVLLNPFGPAGLAFPFPGQPGIQAVMDEHAEFSVTPPLHAAAAFLRRFLHGGVVGVRGLGEDGNGCGEFSGNRSGSIRRRVSAAQLGCKCFIQGQGGLSVLRNDFSGALLGEGRKPQGCGQGGNRGDIHDLSEWCEGRGRPDRSNDIRIRVTAQDFQHGAVLFQLRKGLPEGGFLDVAHGVYVEHVFPVNGLGGAGFNADQVVVMPLEAVDDFRQGAGLVLDADEQGRAVSAAGLRVLAADDDKAGGVAGLVLDVLFQNIQAEQFRGQGAAQGGAAHGRVLLGKNAGLGGGGRLHDFRVREVPQNPVPRLAERLGMGIQDADVLPRNVRHQGVADVQVDLGADFQGGGGEEVHDGGDGPFRGIFHGHHAVLRLAQVNHVKYVLEALAGDQLAALSELLERGLMAPGPLGAQVGDGKAAFQEKGAGNDFTVNGLEGSLREHARVQAVQLVEQGRFPFRNENGGIMFLFNAPDFMHPAGAVFQQFHDLGVHLVNGQARLRQGGGLFIRISAFLLPGGNVRRGSLSVVGILHVSVKAECLKPRQGSGSGGANQD